MIPKWWSNWRVLGFSVLLGMTKSWEDNNFYFCSVKRVILTLEIEQIFQLELETQDIFCLWIKRVTMRQLLNWKLHRESNVKFENCHKSGFEEQNALQEVRFDCCYCTKIPKFFLILYSWRKRLWSKNFVENLRLWIKKLTKCMIFSHIAHILFFEKKNFITCQVLDQYFQKRVIFWFLEEMKKPILKKTCNGKSRFDLVYSVEHPFLHVSCFSEDNDSKDFFGEFDFWIRKITKVRFWSINFTTCQIMNKPFLTASDSELETL